MFARFVLDSKQREVVSKIFVNLGQALLLFSLAAVFAPQVINLQTGLPITIPIISFFLGISGLITSVIMIKRKNKYDL